MKRLLLAAVVLGVLGAFVHAAVQGGEEAEAASPVPFPRSVSPLPVPEIVGRAPWETPLPQESETRRLPDTSSTIPPRVLTCLDQESRGGAVPTTPAPAPSQVPEFCRVQ